MLGNFQSLNQGALNSHEDHSPSGGPDSLREAKTQGEQPHLYLRKATLIEEQNEKIATRVSVSHSVSNQVGVKVRGAIEV